MPDNGVAAYASLGSDVNKRPNKDAEETVEGAVSEKLPELTLKTSDEDIIKLTSRWEDAWRNSSVKGEWQKQYSENEKYWLGKQFDFPGLRRTRGDRPMVDNLIFESLETYLPQVTRRNPEPLVELASQEDEELEANQDLMEKTKNKLGEVAELNRMRLKLKKGARHWALYHIGIGKFGWDLDKDIPSLRIIRPHKIILDPQATVDEDGYTGDRIGEYRTMTAEKLVAILENSDASEGAIKKVKDTVNDEMGTKVRFIEWWTQAAMFWTLDQTVLLKKKNPHWNYDRVEAGTQTDDFGNETPEEREIVGVNHHPVPKMPYEFLSVFNLGDQPMDNTSLIQQNLANQDIINKRNRQIDKNADNMNNGLIISLSRSGLTKSQAKSVATTMNAGGSIVIPDGSPRDAIDRLPGTSLPNDVYTDVVDKRSRLRDIFGTSGSSQAGLQSEKLATGKIMARTLDTDRIGGGVSEYLEQFADDIYNWFLQLLYVYDTGFQFVEGAPVPKMVVSVKAGSLLPKDSIAIANQALDLARLGRISNIDLFKRLEYPNPEDMAANIWLEQNAPQIVFKDNQEVQEAMALQQAQPALGGEPQPITQ